MKSVNNINVEDILQKFYKWEQEHRLKIDKPARLARPPKYLKTLLAVFLDEVLELQVDNIDLLESVMLDIMDREIVEYYDELSMASFK